LPWAPRKATAKLSSEEFSSQSPPDLTSAPALVGIPTCTKAFTKILSGFAANLSSEALSSQPHPNPTCDADVQIPPSATWPCAVFKRNLLLNVFETMKEHLMVKLLAFLKKNPGNA
jgi:hypothetical protein